MSDPYFQDAIVKKTLDHWDYLLEIVGAPLMANKILYDQFQPTFRVRQ